VGDIKVRYYVTRKFKDQPKRGYWAPCLARPDKKTGEFKPTLMAQLGFQHVDCGIDGPLAWAVAESWNRKWDAARAAHYAGAPPDSQGKVFPPDSLGEGFAKFRGTGEWKQMKPRTKEGWLRGWKYIEPTFGDVNPRTVALEHLDLWYHGDQESKPPVQGILQKHGVGESYIAMKYWRAIYAKLLTINRADGERYCVGADPSLGIRRKTPKSRNAIWLYDEARIVIDGAGELGFKGLQAALAVAWDTMMSPVDVRTLTLSQISADDQGTLFQVDRAKTGKAAIGTLSDQTQALLRAYIEELGATLHPESPIFRTRFAVPGPSGGRPRAPVPYSKDTLSKDFRKVLASDVVWLPLFKIANPALALEKSDAQLLRMKNQHPHTRKVMDFRRSGAVEAVAGDVEDKALAGKMANSIDTNKDLQKTYLPAHAAVVRLADAARERGRVVLRSANTKGPKT
jgi:integrase